VGTFNTKSLMVDGHEIVATSFDVKQYGALGDGAHDDTVGIQTAIDLCHASGGGTVYFPEGTYIISENPDTPAFCITVASNVSLLGESKTGSVIKLKDGQALFVRPVNVGNATTPAVNVEIKSLTVDGNKANQAVDEHKAGIFVHDNSSLIHIVDCEIRDNAGDAIGTHNFVSDLVVERCELHDNDRHGVECSGGGQNRFTVRECLIYNNAGIPVNTEIEIGVTDFMVVNNYLQSTGIAVAMDGHNDADRSSGMVIDGNVIIGGVYCIWSDRVRITNNRIAPTADCTVVPVTVFRSVDDVVIANNTILFVPSEATNEIAAILVQGTTDGEQPTNVRIIGNSITSTWGNGAALIFFNNAGSGLVAANSLVAVSGDYGVFFRTTTNPPATMGAFVVHGNYFRDCKRAVVAYGQAGLAESTIASIALVGNTIEKVANANADAAFDLDFDGEHVVQSASAVGNELVNIPVTFKNTPSGSGDGWPACPVLVAGNRGSGGTYSYSGTPEAMITEQPGAMAFDRGAGEAYIKNTGFNTNTGWKLIAHA
jgi:hypothetical protein